MSNLYLGGAQFECQPGHLTILAKVFHDFPLTLQSCWDSDISYVMTTSTYLLLCSLSTSHVTLYS